MALAFSNGTNAAEANQYLKSISEMTNTEEMIRLHDDQTKTKSSINLPNACAATEGLRRIIRAPNPITKINK